MMSKTIPLARAAVAAALALCFTAAPLAQTGSGQGGAGSSPGATGSSTGAQGGAPSSPGAQGGSQSSQGGAQTGSKSAPAAGANTLDAWARGYADQHQGRISRQAYLDEMGRRWDAIDQERRGLTYEDFVRLSTPDRQFNRP